MTYALTYKPDGPILKAYIKSREFVSGLRGPIGSGKSVGSVIKLLTLALEQLEQQDGKRHCRSVVVRNTGPELKTTTIKTWLDWFPEESFGKFNWAPPWTHKIRIGNLRWEVIFLALDRAEDVKKLLSLEATNAWVNEAREVPKAVIDALTERVNRYPSLKDGGAVNPCVIMDTNAPDEDHWWPIVSGEVPIPDYLTFEEARMLIKPEGWEFFVQPAALLEINNEQKQVTGYKLNPAGENHKNLKADYYQKAVSGKTKSRIDVYFLNKLGSDDDTKPVYPDFRKDVHVSREPLHLVPNVPLYVGLDFGLSPAATFGQDLSGGTVQILLELVPPDCSIEQFAPMLHKALLDLGAARLGCRVLIFGDPTGDNRVSTDKTTPFARLRVNNMDARPAPTNDVTIRVESVAAQLRLRDGIVIDPGCRKLIRGFEGKYHYHRIQVQAREARYEDVPNKNAFSHPHDAAQYMMLGMGKGTALLRGKATAAKSTVAKHGANPFDRMAGKSVRTGGMGRFGL